MFRKVLASVSVPAIRAATSSNQQLVSPVLFSAQQFQVACMGTMGSRKKKLAIRAEKLIRNPKETREEDFVHQSVEEIALSIDTTLTPEQFAHAQLMRKKFYGNSKVRSLYRDVATPDEIDGTGNFLPLIAPNANALIDYALSQVPKRAGPRRSRYKRRLQRVQNQKIANDKRRIEQTKASKIKKWEKLRMHKIKTKEYLRLASKLYPKDDWPPKPVDVEATSQ